MSFNDEIKHLEEYLYAGQYNDGIKLALKLEKLTNITESNRDEIQLLKIRLLSDAGRFEEADMLIESRLKLNPSKSLIIDILSLKTISLLFRYKPKEGWEIIEKCKALFSMYCTLDTDENVKRKSYIQFNEALVLWMMCNYHESIKIIQNVIETLKNTREREWIGKAYWLLGNNLLETGELDKAIEVYEKGLELSNEIGYVKTQLWTLVNLGEVYRLQGNLDESLANFTKCLSLFEAQGVISSETITILLNIGLVHNQKGQLDEALHFLNKALEQADNLELPDPKTMIVANIGMVYKQKGDLIQALKYFKLALSIQDEVRRPFDTSQFLLDTISILVERNEIDDAKEYLEKLKSVNENEDNKIIDQRYRLAEALILKAGHRGRDKILASGKFQGLLDEGLVENEYQIFTMINLSECLLDELKAFGEMEVLSNITRLLDKIYDLSLKQNSISLIINSLILRAKLSQIEGNLEKAEMLLEDAIATAKKYKLDSLIKASLEEKNRLTSQYKKWQTLIESNASFKIRLEETQIENYVKMAKNLVFAEHRES